MGNRNRIWVRAILGVLAVGALAVIAGCNDDTERIRGQNEAAEREASGSGGNTGVRSVFDVRSGDCLAESFGADTVYSDSVVVVSCSSPDAVARVTSMFLVERDGAYPPEHYFDDEFYENCDLEATAFMFPTAESWAAGDRTITCVEEMF